MNEELKEKFKALEMKLDQIGQHRQAAAIREALDAYELPESGDLLVALTAAGGLPESVYGAILFNLFATA